MLTADTTVLLRKVSDNSEDARKNAEVPTGYWLKGVLAADLREGATIQVARTQRARQNPEEPEVVNVAGWYVSSPVVTLEAQENESVLAVTRNSRWLISRVDESEQSKPTNQ